MPTNIVKTNKQKPTKPPAPLLNKSSLADVHLDQVLEICQFTGCHSISNNFRDIKLSQIKKVLFNKPFEFYP